MGGCCSREMRRKNLIDTSKKNEDFKKKYEYICTLGDGSFGKVKLFRDRFIHELKFAIKTMRKCQMSSQLVTCLKHEVEVLKRLDHPNIVKYFDTYEDDAFLHIVMEYIPGENLLQVIKQKKINKFTEKQASFMIKNVLKAVMFLHHNNIIHRDIKPENILFSISGDPDSIKLIDFGLSVDEEKQTKIKGGSPNYMAPETLLNKYSKKSDAWSIGVVIFMLLTGKLPFNGADNIELFNNIRNANYDKSLLKEAKISPEAKELIRGIFIADEQLRTGVENILHSSWIKLYEASEELNTQAIIKYFENNNIINNFKKFEKYSSFKKEILFTIAKLSQDDELRQLKKIFMEFDKDSSGTIDKNEIRLIFKNLGVCTQEDELEMIWRSLDFHKDGTVNYTEFLAACLSSSFFLIDVKLRFIFKFFDEFNNDYITPKMIIDCMKQHEIHVNEEEVLKIFNGDKSKKLEYENFKELMKDEDSTNSAKSTFTY